MRFVIAYESMYKEACETLVIDMTKGEIRGDSEIG